MTKSFVHLHLHTEYSLLDGLATIPLAIKKAAEMGMPAIAMTDHGNMYGAVAFYDACVAYNDKAQKQGKNTIKPIFGTEFYVCDDLTQKARLTSNGDDKDRRHLILLVKNEQGYNNIARLNAIAFRDGFYYKPRIDLETLKKYSEGLICLSACVAGDIPQAILHGNYEKAESLITWFKDVFKDDFYLEMQNHGLKEELEVNQYLRAYSKKYGVKTVATNDVHYIDKNDARPHDVLLCVQTQSRFDDPSRMRFSSDEYYLKSYEEMAELFPNDLDALATTVEIAEKCNFEFTYGHYMFPKYIPDTGETPITYIRKLIDCGVAEKYGKETPEIRERIESELAVIEKQGFVEYFLIVWDYINAAKKMGISVGPGRGSGAGSIVAFLIGITDIDPLKYDLYFERFLNAERVSAPDFDVDFEDSRREEVINYVRGKYGDDHVCRIITFGTMAAKNAIKDVGRVLGVSYSDCDKITKAIPVKQNKLGKEVEIKRPFVLQKVFGFYTPSEKEQKEGLTAEHFAVSELVEMYKGNPDIKRVADIAMRLEDTPRQSGIHACGVIIGHDVLEKHMPLSRTSGVEDITSQYTGVELEHLGFLKMDFLGLVNLSDIKRCAEYVKENYGKTVDFSDRRYDDPKVYELISSGNTEAIFQIESPGFKKFLKDLKPNCLEDIIAAVSLYRPGPMESIPKFVESKHNPDKIVFLHPMLKPILEQTYGCIVYQEQVMKIVQELAGYTLGQADMVRRMMGKKKVEAMAKEEEVFINGKPETKDAHGKISRAIDGCIKRGVPEKIARTVWSQMKDFAKYAFNKSHAAAYSVITYQTAYLKTYYEPEFLTAILNNRITKTDEVKHYAFYARSEGIEMLPPDINESEALFSVKDGKIRYGLGAIKNIGVGLISDIIEDRRVKGKFACFEDFIERAAGFNINKRMIENLIYAGAFDSLGKKRSQLIEVFADYLDRVQERNKDKLSNQISMFETVLKDFDRLEITYPDIAEFDSKYKLLKEKEVCGAYITGHPLSDYRELFKKFNFSTAKFNEYEEEIIETEGEEPQVKRTFTSIKEGDRVYFGGIITSIEKIMTKSGSSMGFITIEDLDGSVECTVFPKTLSEAREWIVDDELVEISGRIHIKDNAATVNVDKISKMEVKKTDTALSGEKEFLALVMDEQDDKKLDRIFDILASYSGDIPVYMAIGGKKYDAHCSVRRCEGLNLELRGELSENNIVFFKKKV